MLNHKDWIQEGEHDVKKVKENPICLVLNYCGTIKRPQKKCLIRWVSQYFFIKLKPKGIKMCHINFLKWGLRTQLFYVWSCINMKGGLHN